MKAVVSLIFLGLCALGWAVPAEVQETHHHSKFRVADKDFLEKQEKVLSLFKHINQPDYNPEHVEIVKGYDLKAYRGNFEKPEVADKVIEYYENGYQLPKGEIFSVSYHEHLDQAIALFELFYYAKDFKSFYETAVVARHWVNEGLFLYSFSVAIAHRPDTYGIVLPPIYEVYPYYFFNAETIQEAYKYKQTWKGEAIPITSGKYPGYNLHYNYSGHYLNLHPEQSLSYYLEDVGINNFYYTYFLYYPFWMNGTEYGINKDQRGELYFFIHQQLFSRYYLERLSNGFGQIQALDENVPVETPFYPSLHYHNGLPFPERPRFARLSDYFYHYGQHVNSRYANSFTYYTDLKRRVADAIDRGYAYDRHGEKVDLYDENHGYEYLGNLLQSNPDSADDHFYGPWLGYGRHLLGYSYTPLSPYKVAPSALEHLETTLRDPGFYQLYKQMMNFYRRYQSRLAPYTRDQLAFPGVSIDNIEMDRLITYFDEFYSDLSQAVYYSEDELKQPTNNFHIRTKQYRLNHKPFTYNMHVKSDKDVKAVVKVFIGPKEDEFGRHLNITENRWNFFELDKFITELKTGDNIVKRSSYDSIFFANDKTSYYHLYKQVMGALDGKNEFHVTGKQSYFYFPHRYMLPKGDTAGYPFQFFFIVYPYKPYTGNKPQEWSFYYPRPGLGGPFIDDQHIFYPFDRPIKYEQVITEKVPNVYFYDTKIYHKKDINVVQSED